MQKPWRKPKTLQVAHAVGRVTFLEIVRDKVLYNFFLCALLLLGIGFLGARLSFVSQDRILLDFGLSATGISCAVIAVFIGAGMIGKEFDRRTIFVALSRPISRMQFIFGKFLGISAVLTVNWLLLSMVLVAIVSQAHGRGGLIGPTLYSALVLILFQSWVLTALAIFFSSWTTTSLAVVFSVGCYLVGNNVSQLRLLAGKIESPIGEALLRGVASVLPNLEYFNLGHLVSYGMPVKGMFLLTGIAYALVICAVCIVLAGILIQRREA